MFLTTGRARLILLGLLLIAMSGLRGHDSIAPPPRDPSRVGDTNLQLYTIERIRAGEPYYAAVGSELRKHGYPTSPIVNWRTPLHYEAVAALSIERAGTLLFVLAMAVVVSGALVYSQHSIGRCFAGGLILLITMAPAMLVRPGAVVFPEMWAGVLIGLSLNAYLARQWAAGAAIGVLAVFVRELAVPYAAVCGLLALRARRSAESRLWIAGAVGYVIYYALHTLAASAAIQPGDLVREASYLRLLGLPFVFMTLYLHGGLTVLPPFITPVGASLGLAACWGRTAPGQLTLSLPLYFVLFCLVGQPFNNYWGYLTAPIWGHAFVHSAEGLRILISSARGGAKAAARDRSRTSPTM